MQSDTTVHLPLRARDGSIRAYALIDARDATFLNQWQWRLSNHGYATAIIDHRRVQLHRLLLGLRYGDDLEGDHINRDRLDDRRVNLRIVTRSQGVQNCPSNRGSISNFRGVSWRKDIKKWKAYIRVNKVLIHLGMFTDELEAAKAARAARARLMPFATD